MTLMERPTSRRGLKGAAIVGAGLVVGFRFDPRTITGQALAAEGGNGANSPPTHHPHRARQLGHHPLQTYRVRSGAIHRLRHHHRRRTDAHRDQIKVEHAPADVTKYANTLWAPKAPAAGPRSRSHRCGCARPG